MSQPEDKKAQVRRLKHERADLHEGILAVALGWGTLEDQMALFLNQMITAKGYGPGVPIYFAPENSATRSA